MKDTSLLNPLAPDPNNNTNNEIVDGSISMQYTVDGVTLTLDPIERDTANKEGFYFEQIFDRNDRFTPVASQMTSFLFRVRNPNGNALALNMLSSKETDYLLRKLAAIGQLRKWGKIVGSLHYALAPLSRLGQAAEPHINVADYTNMQRPFDINTPRLHFRTTSGLLYTVKFVEEPTGYSYDDKFRLRFAYGTRPRFIYCELLDGNTGELLNIGHVGRYEQERIALYLHPLFEKIFAREGKVLTIEFLYDYCKVYSWQPSK